jgi:hypothetical protein
MRLDELFHFWGKWDRSGQLQNEEANCRSGSGKAVISTEKIPARGTLLTPRQGSCKLQAVGRSQIVSLQKTRRQITHLIAR